MPGELSLKFNDAWSSFKAGKKVIPAPAPKAPSTRARVSPEEIAAAANKVPIEAVAKAEKAGTPIPTKRPLWQNILEGAKSVLSNAPDTGAPIVNPLSPTTGSLAQQAYSDYQLRQAISKQTGGPAPKPVETPKVETTETYKPGILPIGFLQGMTLGSAPGGREYIEKRWPNPTSAQKVALEVSEFAGGAVPWILGGQAVEAGAGAVGLGREALQTAPLWLKGLATALRGAATGAAATTISGQNPISRAGAENVLIGAFWEPGQAAAEALLPKRLPAIVSRPIGASMGAAAGTAASAITMTPEERKTLAQQIRQQALTMGGISLVQTALGGKEAFMPGNLARQISQAVSEQASAPKLQATMPAPGRPRVYRTGEISYQQAMDNLQQGIETLQNAVGHSDVLAAYPPGTTVERAFADLKEKTGVDIYQLIADVDNARQRQPLREQFAAGEERRRLARVAGASTPLSEVRIKRSELAQQIRDAVNNRFAVEQEGVIIPSKEVPSGGRTGESTTYPGAGADTTAAGLRREAAGRFDTAGDGTGSVQGRSGRDSQPLPVGIAQLDPVTEAGSFRAHLSEAQQSHKYGWSVDVHGESEYQAMRLFTAAEGKAGVAVEPDGNINSLFKNPAVKDREAIPKLMFTALQNGGNKLDCYDANRSFLPDLYMQFGFEPVARVKFDPRYAEGWDKSRGTPDVVIFRHNGDSIAEIIRKREAGLYPSYDPSAVPYASSYEAAKQMRDQAMSRSNLARSLRSYAKDVQAGKAPTGSKATMTDYQKYQDQIDAYEKQLISKYGEAEVDKVPIIMPKPGSALEEVAKIQETSSKLAPDEIRKLRSLYAQRDAVGKQIDRQAFDSVMQRIPDAGPAKRSDVEYVVKDAQRKFNIWSVEGPIKKSAQAGIIDDVAGDIYSSLAQRLGYDGKIKTWSLTEALEEARRGKADSLIAQVKGIMDAIFEPVKPENVQTMSTPAQPPATTAPQSGFVRRSDIVRQLSDALAPIRTGRFAEKAAGIFKIKPEVIRTRTANDLPTISHEVGHFLDKRFGLSQGNAHDAELLNLGAPQARSGMTPDQIRAEGIAEFMRLYLTDEQAARRLTPGYYNAFERLMIDNPEIHDILLQARKDISLWYNQPAEARVQAVIDSGKEKSFMDRLRSVAADWNWDRIYQGLFDELIPLKRFSEEMGVAKIEEDPYRQAWLARGWVGKAETALKYGVMDENGNKIGASLEEILKPMRNELDDFIDYIASKHSLEITKAGKGSAITDADAQAVIDKAPPEYQAVLDRLVEFQNTVMDRTLVKSGVMNRDAVAAMRKMYPSYVPFHRVFEENPNAAREWLSSGGFANVPSPVKRLKGSERDIINPIESIIKNVYLYTNIAERNNVGRAIVDLAQGREGMGRWVEKVEGGRSSKENVLDVWRNGEVEHYQLDPDLYQATLMLDRDSAGFAMKLLSYPAQWLRAGAVLSPDFIVRNPIRDLYSATVYSRYGFVPGVDTIKGLFHAIKKDPLYWTWMNSGAAHSVMVGLDRDYLQNSMREMFASGKLSTRQIRPLEWLRALAEFTEQANRIGEFERGLKQGAKVSEAALSARDITIDFARMGTKTKILNKLIAFFNASIQGPDKMVRAFRENPVGTTTKSLLYVTLPSVLLYFVNRNNPDYKRIPQWERDMFWCIPAGSKEVKIGNTSQKVTNWIRIPKPFELGILFGTVPERVLDWIDQQDPKAFNDLSGTIIGAGMPGVVPTFMQPLIEIWANKSFLTGGPVVGQREQGLEPYAQYGPYTTELAKAAGRTFNVSPRQVEQVMRGYTGGLGMYAAQALNRPIRALTGEEDVPAPARPITEMPVIRAFTISPGSQTQSMDNFYTKLDRMNRQYNTAKDQGLTDTPPAELSYMRSVSNVLSDLRKAEREVERSGQISSTDKAVMLERIRLYSTQLAETTVKRVEYIESTQKAQSDMQKNLLNAVRQRKAGAK